MDKLKDIKMEGDQAEQTYATSAKLNSNKIKDKVENAGSQ